jgi:hypothetical protein
MKHQDMPDPESHFRSGRKSDVHGNYSVSYGRLEKQTVMEGTDAAGNRMLGSSKRKGI